MRLTRVDLGGGAAGREGRRPDRRWAAAGASRGLLLAMGADVARRSASLAIVSLVGALFVAGPARGASPVPYVAGEGGADVTGGAVITGDFGQFGRVGEVARLWTLDGRDQFELPGYPCSFDDAGTARGLALISFIRVGARLLAGGTVFHAGGEEAEVMSQPDDTPAERALCEAVLARGGRAVLASDDLGRTWRLADPEPVIATAPDEQKLFFLSGAVYTGSVRSGWAALDPGTLTWSAPTDAGLDVEALGDTEPVPLRFRGRRLHAWREITADKTVALYQRRGTRLNDVGQVVPGSPNRSELFAGGGEPSSPQIVSFTNAHPTRVVSPRLRLRVPVTRLNGDPGELRSGRCRRPRGSTVRAFDSLFATDNSRVLFGWTATDAPARCATLPRENASLSLKSVLVRSTNGGRSWRRVRMPRGARLFAVDDTTPIYTVRSRRCTRNERLVYYALRKLGCRPIR